MSKVIIPDKAVLKFEASWCGPCKAITPYIEELKKKYPDVPVVVIDADEEPDVCHEYDVTKLPTFVFKNGKQKSVIIGTDKINIELNFGKLNNLIVNQNQTAKK